MPKQSNTGQHIQAHGAGVFEEDGTYYLIGEDHTDGSAFLNINCYSSTDLVQWKYVGALLSRTTAAGDLGPDRVVERPKVIYNSSTGKYVLYMHIDDSSYAEAKVSLVSFVSIALDFYGGSRYMSLANERGLLGRRGDRRFCLWRVYLSGQLAAIGFPEPGYWLVPGR